MTEPTAEIDVPHPDDVRRWLDAALAQAEKSWREGGIPIGAALVDEEGTVVALGHNERVQSGDPTAHAEVVCIRNAGRRRLPLLQPVRQRVSGDRHGQ